MKSNLEDVVRMSEEYRSNLEELLKMRRELLDRMEVISEMLSIFTVCVILRA